MNATALEARSLHHVPPGDLLLERNIRDVTPSPDLVDSIKAIGLCEPITAVTNADGRLVVRFGHRRTVAAVEAKLKTVPVYVLGPDQADTDAEVARIISQRDENTVRAGLTASDEIGVVEQLHGLGLSADQMVKQARLSRENVDSAIAASGSTLARKAAERYESLTLDQAAAVAEFEDDPEVAKQLVVHAIENPNAFAHLAQRKRDDRDRARLEAEARTRLEAEGVKVLDDRPDYTKGLGYLVDVETREEVTEANHAECPGRACTLEVAEVWVDKNEAIIGAGTIEARAEELYASAVEAARADAEKTGADPDDYVDEDELWVGSEAAAVKEFGVASEKRAIPVWYCLDPVANGHVYRYGGGAGPARTPAAEMSEKERAAAKKARALVVENNRAWASAATVRREWLKVFAKLKTAPKGTGSFLAEALQTDIQDLFDYQVNDLAGEWLGIRDRRAGYAKAAAAATDGRALVIALVQVLARHEGKAGKFDDWRLDGTSSRVGRYLRFLELCGYPLSDVEKFAISKKTA